MFSDPLTLHSDWSAITVDAGQDFVFAASERASDHSTYRFVDYDTNTKPVNWTLFMGHQYNRRRRFTGRVTMDTLLPDLLTPANNSQFSASCYVVVDLPSSGYFEPYGGTPPAIASINSMMKMVGGLLVSVDTADPLFLRVLNGET